MSSSETAVALWQFYRTALKRSKVTEIIAFSAESRMVWPTTLRRQGSPMPYDGEINNVSKF